MDESILAIQLKEIDLQSEGSERQMMEGSMRNMMKIRKKKPFEQRGYQGKGKIKREQQPHNQQV